jgi:hypothetical protein
MRRPSVTVTPARANAGHRAHVREVLGLVITLSPERLAAVLSAARSFADLDRKEARNERDRARRAQAKKGGAR